MKIEDCQTLPEFFGVEGGDIVWIEGEPFLVYKGLICGENVSSQTDSKALVGCLTGQLEWSRHEPMTADEEKLLREIAAWFPDWYSLNMSGEGYIFQKAHSNSFWNYPFGTRDNGSKAYTVLAPILEKYGEISLDDYR